MTRTFVHRTHKAVDPAFLREERKFLEQGRVALRVMELHRDQLAEHIAQARALAEKAGVSLPRSADQSHKKLAVIGVGDERYGDDRAGLEVARRLRAKDLPGVTVLDEGDDARSLVQDWSGADQVLVVDAINSGFPAGTVHRFDVSDEPLPRLLFKRSTHAHGVADAVELARKLDSLPKRLAVYGLEGERFERDEELTSATDAAVEKLVEELSRELREMTRNNGAR